MLVTAIKGCGRNEAEIVIEDEEPFRLYSSELSEYGIYEGAELTQQTVGVLYELIQKRATIRAMHLLKARDYTTFRLREKLKSGGYPDVCTDYAIEYVTRCGYLNDDRYARNHISYHFYDRTRYRLISDLTDKGINRELAEFVYAEVENENGGGSELEQAVKHLVKKGYKAGMSDSDRVTTSKMMASLARKGFPAGVIREAIGHLDIEGAQE